MKLKLVCVTEHCKEMHYECTCGRWTHGPLPCLTCRVNDEAAHDLRCPACSSPTVEKHTGVIEFETSTGRDKKLGTFFVCMACEWAEEKT